MAVRMKWLKKLRHHKVHACFGGGLAVQSGGAAGSAAYEPTPHRKAPLAFAAMKKRISPAFEAKSVHVEGESLYGSHSSSPLSEAEVDALAPWRPSQIIAAARASGEIEEGSQEAEREADDGGGRDGDDDGGADAVQATVRRKNCRADTAALAQAKQAQRSASTSPDGGSSSGDGPETEAEEIPPPDIIRTDEDSDDSQSVGSDEEVRGVETQHALIKRLLRAAAAGPVLLHR